MSKHVLFIIPDWDDIVDPGYNFLAEERSEVYCRDKFVFGARLWDFFDPPPVDGVLMSISTLSKRKLEAIERAGDARRFLRLPQGLQLIGDCGAWQYRYRDEPPYTVEYVLEMYRRLRVDYGVTVDHIPFFGNPEERMRMTMESAIKSYELWKPRFEKGDYSFVLMASVQGIEVRDYLKSFERLYSTGFRHFAIGGLAKRDSEFIKRLVAEFREVLKRFRDVEKIHMLGVARASVVPYLRELLDYVEEVSFDNATFLRMAWVRTVGNYILPDGRVYTSVRVMDSNREVLEVLTRYGQGAIGLDEVVSTLSKYLARTGDFQYLPYYIATLRDRPWKQCGCTICRSIGIQVVIFRGNDRNRRRGFHNVYVFGQLLKQGLLEKVRFRLVKADQSEIEKYRALIAEDTLIEGLATVIRSAEKILVLTNCTAEKSVDMNLVRQILSRAGLPIPSFDLYREQTYRELLKQLSRPAKEMYSGPTFRAVLNLVNELRKCGKKVHLYIISARYGVVEENEPIIPYDATLKGMQQKDLTKWREERKVIQRLTEIIQRERYELAIVALPKEYAQAILDFLEKKPVQQTIIITTRTVVRKLQKADIIALPGGTIPQRLKYIKKLSQATQKACIKTLEQWIKENYDRTLNKIKNI
jgi:HEPN domain-containing protein